MSISITVHLNGKTVSAQVQASTSLVEFLREHQRLTGTHVGCDTAQCGACTVLVDGKAMKSCNMLAVQADGLSITTIEGLAAADGSLHPMQAAFRDCHGLQCGFCTPGMLTTLHALLSQEPDADEERIRDVLSGNICRCTGYIPIIEAAMEAREAYRAKAGDR